jgi:Flp pilus assembly secretin CpaC
MTMNRRRLSTAIALTIFVMGATARAQEPAAGKPAAAQPQSSAPKGLVTALMLEVTLSRYLGDKRISAVPYSLAVTPDNAGRATLRVGGDVPIPSIGAAAPAASAEDKSAQPQPRTSYNYRAIGTNIDGVATVADDGRFRIGITVEDSSVYPAADAAKNMATPSGAPAFRSFRASNTVTLRDGQSIEYVAATDRISGETVRISVRLTVVR